MRLIIDADTPLYRAAAAAQHKEYHVLDGSKELGVFRYHKEALAFIKQQDNKDLEMVPEVIVEEEYAALHNLDSIMEGILSELPHDSYTTYVAGVGNYRYQINPEYKAGRPPRPIHYAATKQRLIDVWGGEEVDDMEVDDACSIDQNSSVEDTILVSIDKDLDMVPGHHYNWVKKTKYFISEDGGDYNFYIQLLTGDSTDNIHGLVGIGPVTAKKILKGATTTQERFERCRRAYTQAKRDDISTVARQIWMSKYKPDDWEPPCMESTKRSEDDTND